VVVGELDDGKRGDDGRPGSLLAFLLGARWRRARRGVALGHGADGDEAEGIEGQDRIGEGDGAAQEGAARLLRRSSLDRHGD